MSHNQYAALVEWKAYHFFITIKITVWSTAPLTLTLQLIETYPYRSMHWINCAWNEQRWKICYFHHVTIIFEFYLTNLQIIPFLVCTQVICVLCIGLIDEPATNSRIRVFVSQRTVALAYSTFSSYLIISAAYLFGKSVKDQWVKERDNRERQIQLIGKNRFILQLAMEDIGSVIVHCVRSVCSMCGHPDKGLGWDKGTKLLATEHTEVSPFGSVYCNFEWSSISFDVMMK